MPALDYRILHTAPCESCELADICRLGYACAAFAGFVKGGNDSYWRRASRVPSRVQYRRLIMAPPPESRPLTERERSRIEAVRERELRERAGRLRRTLAELTAEGRPIASCT